MSDRREVNVGRPEHSWIPFYRELAEKLVEDGWRERQRELVGVLKEMDAEGLRMPPLVRKLDLEVDPISVLAMFNRNLNTNDNRAIIHAFKERFDLRMNPPEVDPFVPKSNRYVISSATNPNPIWELVSSAINTDSFDPNSNVDEFVNQFDACLMNIGISKLTAGLYWSRPGLFLHNDTVDAIGGRDLGIVAKDGKSYVVCLNRTSQLTELSFPEINIGVWTQQRINPHERNLWVVRAGEINRLSPEFRSGDYVAFNFGFDDLDLSGVSSVVEAEQRIKAHRPNRTDAAIRQMSQFLMSMKIGDYVLMPDRDRDFIHHGTIASDPYFGLEGTHKNRRQIEWDDSRRFTREELGWRGRAYGATVNRVRGDLRDRFLAVINDDPVVVPAPVHTIYRMPEDSWVRFHLEVGRHLVEGEWWLPEKRDEFQSFISQIFEAAGETDEEVLGNLTPDPYSLYLAFNTAFREPYRYAGYEKTRELFDISAHLPERGHYARRFGVHYWVEMRLEPTGVEILWDLFRFVIDADPANDDDDAAELARRFDTVCSHEVPGMAGATLTQWLYWIDPTKYLLTRRLSANELGLVADLGIREPVDGGSNYIEALKAVQKFARSKGKTLLDINRESTTRESLGMDRVIMDVEEAYGIQQMIDEDVFLGRKEIERMKRILESKKNLILQGPPGVGKTFIARKLAYVLMGRKSENRITSVQFHQSYSYEDFVGGFRPDVENDQMVFTRQDGPFLKVCKDARDNPDVDYVVLIDEINRGNLSRVFGELLLLIEADKRKPEFGVTLQHRPDDEAGFFVPENVYIIGTMNLADRSLTGMNVAMRRRFGFVDLKPQFNQKVFTDWLSEETDMPPGMQDRINAGMATLNSTIAVDPSLGVNYAVGHSFFCPPEGEPAGGWEEWYETVVEYEIRPLLREYWFDAPDTANAEADKLR